MPAVLRGKSGKRDSLLSLVQRLAVQLGALDGLPENGYPVVAHNVHRDELAVRQKIEPQDIFIRVGFLSACRVLFPQTMRGPLTQTSYAFFRVKQILMITTDFRIALMFSLKYVGLPLFRFLVQL